MSELQNNSTFRVLAACLLGAAMFAVLPASATTPVRDAIRVALSPGQRCVSSVVSSAESRGQSIVDQKLAEQQQQIEQLTSELQLGQLRERRALLVAQSTRQALGNVEQQGATPFDVTHTPELIRPRAIRATVLGRELLSELKSRRILDRGQTDGVTSDLWVLEGGLPIVEAGSELNVADGLPVFAGRCIVGRIVETGRWTSSLQYLTEPGFRARAVLARNGSIDSPTEGFSFGSEGLIEGRAALSSTGQCELTQIPAAERVEVGMSVYSPPGHAVDAPMLFGHVVSAELIPGALHWRVTVQPAVDFNRLHHVEIAVPEVKTGFEAPLANAPSSLVAPHSQAHVQPAALTPGRREPGRFRSPSWTNSSDEEGSES